MCTTLSFSQSINFDQLGREKWLRYNGGISANGVYYNGTANRQPFTYYLQGNLNFNVAGVYNIPLSFTYSNQEFDFPTPFKFNRFSFHPSYKWITAHLGDANMTFSPYTLSGHQFTGAGVELSPEGPFKVSAMYGRLLKATEYNEAEPKAITSYKRKGYGIKASYDFSPFKIGAIFFKAIDEEQSLQNPFPVELGLSPKENAVVSLESEVTVLDKLNFRVEYAVSGVTEDTRLTDKREKKGILAFMFDENISTQYYNALNVGLNYPAWNGTLGLTYERIDPEYKTLGAYYFNNDLENITVNASQTIFDGKVSVNVNAGLQQNNLDKSKSSEQQRIVSAVNVNYNASDRLGFNASYSNFQSYTNIRDQFDYINQVGEFDNIDTLNYRQISQNANLGINYVVKQTESKQQTANLNLVYQNSDNQQNGETIEGGLSSFYNSTAAYTMGYPKQSLSFSLAANTSYNVTASDNSLTFGPTIVIGKQFFDKQLRTNLSSSYNTSYSNGEQQSTVYNFRLGSNYVWLKKHNFSLNVLMLFRNSGLNRNNDFTATLGYTYTFDNFRLDLNLSKRKLVFPTDKNSLRILSFKYKNVVYSGTMPEINEQLTTVSNSSQFNNIPSFKKDQLSILLATVKEQTKEDKYKENAIVYLDALYDYGDFTQLFNNALFEVVFKIKRDMRKIDNVLEKMFVEAKLKVDEHPLNPKKQVSLEINKEDHKEYNQLVAEEKDRLEKLVGHRWMEEKFTIFRDREQIENANGLLEVFKNKMQPKAYQKFENVTEIEALERYLEEAIIDFYYKESLKLVNPETFELKYINKN